MCVDVPTYAEEDYAISEERLRAAITPRTKAIIFNNPTNPTGMGYDLSTMEMLARVAKEYDLLIAADEIYTTYIPYLSLVRPKGTFYLFPGVEKTGLDDKQFCKELLERAHVLVSAGSPFGKTGANHFRIACTVGIDQLKQAFDRMEKLEF